MLDKVRFFADDFQLMECHNLTLKRHNLDSKGKPVSEAIAYYDYNGAPVEGKGAFNNSNGINIDIQNGYLAIEYNPPKLINGNNYLAVTPEQLDVSIDYVDSHVRNSVGINFNIDNAKLSRIDLCKNIETDRSFEDYLGALDAMIDPRYMPIIDSETNEGYWKKKNRSFQVVFYDKLQELRNNQKIKPASLGIQSANIMRGELRFMNPRKVRNALETHTIFQLRQTDHFDHLEERYKAIMSKDIFKYSSDRGILGDFDDLRASLLAVHQRYKRDTIIHWLAMNTEIRQHTFQHIRQIIESSGIMNRQNVHKNMQKVRHLFEVKGEGAGMPSYTSLVDEIYTKLVA